MNFYLKKYGFQSPVLRQAPNPNLGISIVIPCFNEPDLIPTLEALYSCQRPKSAVEVIVVINSGKHHPVSIRNQNNHTIRVAEEWIKKYSTSELRFNLIHEPDLPKKHAGVGLARKIGMDEAVYRFHLLNKDGIIVCFDADSSCDRDYLVAIESHFNGYPKTPGCSIHFEHPLEGEIFEAEIYQGIVNYELHLRYYNQALKYAGLPYAFHTVGSSMAVRSSAYQKQGGMNKRKAGEDFYFIHKIIALGNFTELKSTRVIPSPRISDRVPFGTGKAIGDWVKSQENTYQTYAFESFLIIKTFVHHIPDFRLEEPGEIQISLSKTQLALLFEFLEEQNFDKALAEIRMNSKGEPAFIKRFFRWFDAFKILKMVHYFRDHGLENKELVGEVDQLISSISNNEVRLDEKEQLLFLRKLERK